MNIKLSDWNKSINYASSVVDKLKSDGHNVSFGAYTMYDNRKGIHLDLYDNQGGLFKRESTGIHKDFDEMKSAIDSIANRIPNY